MRTTFSALLIAAAFVSASAGAKAADASIENAGNQAIVFATKGFVAPVQTENRAPVFTAGQNRGIATNPAGSQDSGR
jgi:hypothetical protein